MLQFILFVLICGGVGPNYNFVQRIVESIVVCIFCRQSYSHRPLSWADDGTVCRDHIIKPAPLDLGSNPVFCDHSGKLQLGILFDLVRQSIFLIGHRVQLAVVGSTDGCLVILAAVNHPAAAGDLNPDFIFLVFCSKIIFRNGIGGFRGPGDWMRGGICGHRLILVPLIFHLQSGILFRGIGAAALDVKGSFYRLPYGHRAGLTYILNGDSCKMRDHRQGIVICVLLPIVGHRGCYIHHAALAGGDHIAFHIAVLGGFHPGGRPFIAGGKAPLDLWGLVPHILIVYIENGIIFVAAARLYPNCIAVGRADGNTGLGGLGSIPSLPDEDYITLCIGGEGIAQQRSVDWKIRVVKAVEQFAVEAADGIRCGKAVANRGS